MKNSASTVLLLLVITIMSSACEEYAEWFPPKGQPQPRDSVMVDSAALLTWTGEYDVDGCGFFITIDGEEYKPEYEDSIDDSFKEVYSPYGTEVVIEYQILDKEIESYCESMPITQTLPVIRIISIQPSERVITSEAVVSWTGEYEVDGCGFFVTVDSIRYKPDNEEVIDDSFKDSSSSEGIDVVVKYKTLSIEKAFYCGDVSIPQTASWIEVFSLQRR